MMVKMMFSKSLFKGVGVLMGLLLMVSAGCSDDAATSTSCTFDTDCTLGTVCSVDKVCVKADCNFCSAEQVCLVTAENPQGSCSAPECATDTDCADKGGKCKLGLCTDQQCTTSADCPTGQVCNLANQCVVSDGTCTNDGECPAGQVCKSDACVPGCGSDADCEAGKFCNEDSVCLTGCRDNSECGSNQVCNEGSCDCTPGGCGEGKFCNLDNGDCETVTSCAQVTCPNDQVCNPVGLTCTARCTADSCGAGQACNMATGVCETTNCPGADPTQCEGTSRPIWDPLRCFCAECTTNNDCNTAAGEVCTAAGSCFACQTACDPGTPGTCQGTTPYCINECCVQCVGAADCPQGQLCLEGTCGTPPNCTADPTVCPAGTTCQNGTCSANQGGQTCDPMNPTTCPEGTFCDPSTGMCGGLGGGLGCGLCNPDCTCDGGLSCNGFFCEGCDPLSAITGGPSCPNGETCLPLEALGLGNICMAL